MRPNLHTQTDTVSVYHGDSIDTMRELPDNSVDSIVTDPPYGLSAASPQQIADTMVAWATGDRAYMPAGKGFMGKSWDGFVPPPALWDEAMRVLKPGGHLLAFAGSRTQDLMGLSIRLAGFEIRESVCWLYGSGFPKSLDVSKAIDKARTEDLEPAAAVAKFIVQHMTAKGLTRQDLNREVVGVEHAGGSAQQWTTVSTTGAVKPRIPQWEQWQALKSLLGFGDEMDAEVWRLNGRKGKPGDNFDAREVLSERVTEVKGGSWADHSATGRFTVGEKVIRETAPATPAAQEWEGWGTALKPAFEPVVVGRKPLVGTVAQNVQRYGTGALNIDGSRIGTGEGIASAGGTRRSGGIMGGSEPLGGWSPTPGQGRWPANVVLDETTATLLDQQSGLLGAGSYPGRTQAKPKFNGSTYANGQVYDGKVDAEPRRTDAGGASRFFYVAKAPKRERPVVDGVAHPTVKPLALMRWLVKLVTPAGGTVLEPFAGSGATVEACLLEGFNVIAVEREAEYLPLIQARIDRQGGTLPVAA